MRLLETAFKHAITPFVFLDKDFNFIRVNEAYGKACGHSARDLKGRNYFELHPSDAKAIFDRVIETKRPYEAVSWPLIFSDHPELGITYWNWVLVPGLDSGGEVEFLAFSLNDVTEWKRMEESLKESREGLENAVREKTEELRKVNEDLMSEIAEGRRIREELRESRRFIQRTNEMSPDFLYLYDLVERRNLFQNKERVLGYTAEDMTEMGENFFKEVVHPDDLQQVEKHLEHSLMLEDGEILEHECRVRHGRTGEYHWVRSSDVVFSRDSNGVPRVILGTARDITGQKDLKDRLVRVEHQFSQFAENVDSVIWIISLDANRILYINRAYERIWGRSCESLIREPSSLLDALHPEDREDLARYFAQEKQEERGSREYRILRPDRTIRWIRDRAFPIRNADGETIYLAGIAEDITEEKGLREEAECRLQQVLQAEKLASLGQIVAGVAHEINNPNSFIAHNIPLLEQTWRLVEPMVAEYGRAHPEWKDGELSLDELCKDIEEIIEDIRAGSDRLNKVARNLKDFARMDEEGHPSLVKVNEVIEKTMMFVGAQLRKLAARIDLDLGDGLPEIEGFFNRLEQVAANLLVNAAHAIEDKERGRISIATRWVERLQSILIEVEDNGRGMTMETSDHIFDPFFTTRRMSGGTGLGLSVSYGLVQEHNGMIGVLSRPGRGSRFTVYLPIDSSVKLDLHPTILCVDRDAAFLNMLQTQFIRAEECFEKLHDPEIVMAYLEEHPEVDIVLSDLMMPDMIGWELLARVKKRFPLLPFILFSGDSMALQSKPEHVPDPDYTLEKPFEMRRLANAIASMGRQRL